MPILIIRWTSDRRPIVPNKLVWRTIARIQITSGVDPLALAASHTKFGGRPAASMQGFVTYRRPRLINPRGTMAGIRAPRPRPIPHDNPILWSCITRTYIPKSRQIRRHMDARGVTQDDRLMRNKIVGQYAGAQIRRTIYQKKIQQDHTLTKEKLVGLSPAGRNRKAIYCRTK